MTDSGHKLALHISHPWPGMAWHGMACLCRSQPVSPRHAPSTITMEGVLSNQLFKNFFFSFLDTDWEGGGGGMLLPTPEGMIGIRSFQRVQGYARYYIYND